MKDYERYMNRQRMSETGMAKLMKLETERPEKGTRAGKKRQALPRWAKTLGMAAGLVLVVGLCALPVLRQVGQWGRPTEEELYFYEVDDCGDFESGFQYGEEKERLEPAEAAEIFGCAPDDFVGFLETMGLDKFDIRYRVMDTGSGGVFRFLMEGFYTSPMPEEVKLVSSFFPSNSITLEIQEMNSEAAVDWSQYRFAPRLYQGHQVMAYRDTNGYGAAAFFYVESGGKTYRVGYGVDTFGERNAKELVTNMVSYLTTNGLFVEDRGTPQVKTTGLYVMERGESDYPVMPRISFDGESYTFGQSLLSSHLCRGGYEVANGRVTARCNEHHFVFDILDENTLRFVGAESSRPESYGDDDWPKITDGAVFRWQEQLVFNQVDDVPASMGDVVLGNQNKEMTVPEIAMILFSSEDGWDDLLETLGWTEYDVSGQSTPAGRDPETGWSINRFMLRGKDGQGNSFELDLQPNTTMFREEFDGLETSQVYGHTVTAVSGFDTAARLYRSAAAFEVADAPCDYGVYYAVAHADQETAEEMVTKLVNDLTGRGVFTEMYGISGGEELPTLTYAELTQPYVDEDYVRGTATLNWKTQRSMTREELEAVFPACAGEAGENYIWYGTVYFEDDGNLQTVVITGDTMDGSGTVTITTSMEEGLTFIRNVVEENGEATYFGTDNTKYVYGMDLVRCFYVKEPGHFANAESGYYCYAQYQLTGSALYTEVRSSVNGGSLLENEAFNTQWFDTVNRTGLWFHTGNVNGKDIWKLPELDEAAEAGELSGTYFMQSDVDGTWNTGVKVSFDEYQATISSDRLNFHTWLCSNRMRERVNGKELVRMTCDKCGGIYSFVVVDRDTLQFDMSNSAIHDHHNDWTFEVSDGTVFRHLRDGEDATALPVVFGAPQSQTEEWKQGGATVISW